MIECSSKQTGRGCQGEFWWCFQRAIKVPSCSSKQSRGARARQQGGGKPRPYM